MIPQPMMAPPPDVESRRPVKAAPPPSSLSGDRKAASSKSRKYSSEQLAALRIFRTEIQDLQRALGSVLSGEIPLKEFAAYITQTQADIKPGLDELKEIEIEQGEDADTIRHLRNTWEQVMDCPLLKDPSKEGFTPQDQLRYLKMLDGAFREIVFQVGFLTIPERLKDWLALGFPGYYVPFHEVFADEVPNYEDRVKLLKYFSWMPRMLPGGLTDPSSGLIYNYSTSRWRQIWYLFWFALALFGTPYLVLSSAYLNHFTIFGLGPFGIQGWPITPDKQSILFGAWIAVLIGIIVHNAVGTFKRAQVQGVLPPVLAFGDLPLWINAKLGNILFKLGLTVIAVFAFLFSAGTADPQLLQAFFVGYSFDSFVELLGTSLEQRATAQVATLKKQLGVTES